MTVGCTRIREDLPPRRPGCGRAAPGQVGPRAVLRYGAVEAYQQLAEFGAAVAPLKVPVYANWGSLGSNVVQLEISSFQGRRNFLDSGTMASSGSAIVCVAFKALSKQRLGAGIL